MPGLGIRENNSTRESYKEKLRWRTELLTN